MNTEKSLRRKYVLADYMSTLAGVMIFTIVRYYVVPGITEHYPSLADFISARGPLLSFALFPPFMLLLYYLTGYYVNVTQKSRIKEFLRTVSASAAGSIVYFLVVLLNDILPKRTWNYEVLLLFAGILFATVYISRLSLTTYLRRSMRRPGSEKSYILVTASTHPASDLEWLKTVERDYHFRITAICSTSVLNATDRSCISPDDLETYAAANRIDGVVLRPSGLDEEATLKLLNRLFSFDVPVLTSPDDRAMIFGHVRFDAIDVTPLVDISKVDLPDNIVAIKRFVDILVSSIALAITSPVILALAMVIKRQSPGPVFYSQERIGYRRRPFHIYKLRSMITESEPSGPVLSRDNDPRITPIGQFMRKYRLDELPNLWNVLKGDMSLVGPRPEREYFIRRIIDIAPHYTLLHLVRPGLTSWGMVRYGYASDVPSMVERMRFDLLYVSNLSLSVDMRIMLHTILTICRGEGK